MSKEKYYKQSKVSKKCVERDFGKGEVSLYKVIVEGEYLWRAVREGRLVVPRKSENQSYKKEKT